MGFFGSKDEPIRSATGTTTGASWAVGENTSGVIGLVPVNDTAREELLAFDEDPRVLVHASQLAVRDASIEALTPGSPVGATSVPLVVLYMNALQGLVLAG